MTCRQNGLASEPAVINVLIFVLIQLEAIAAVSWDISSVCLNRDRHMNKTAIVVYLFIDDLGAVIGTNCLMPFSLVMNVDIFIDCVWTSCLCGKMLNYLYGA